MTGINDDPMAAARIIAKYEQSLKPEPTPDAVLEALSICAGFAEGVRDNRKPGDLAGKSAANEILSFIEDLIAERNS